MSTGNETDYANLVIAFGTFVASAGAAAVAWWQGILASRAREDAENARDAAAEALQSAKDHARAAERQASAAEDSSLTARRQAETAERSVDQVDQHRLADRRGEAVAELSQLLYGAAAVGRSIAAWSERTFTLFENEQHLIRAYSLLGPDDVAIGRWASKKRSEIHLLIERAQGEIASNSFRQYRGGAARTAAESVEKLILWQRGDLDISWFEDELAN